MAPSDPVKDEADKVAKEAKKGFFSYARQWGDSSLPPTLLATLITPLHIQPFQKLPMLFPPVLLGCSYANLNGYPKEAAGISAAWSGIYMLLANRRKHKVMQKFGARGLVRGSAMAVAGLNVVGGGVSYIFGRNGD